MLVVRAFVDLLSGSADEVVHPRREARAGAGDDVVVGERDERRRIQVEHLVEHFVEGSAVLRVERREVEAVVGGARAPLVGAHLVDVEAVRDVHRAEGVAPEVVGEVPPLGGARPAGPHPDLVDDRRRQVGERLERQRRDGVHGVDLPERHEDVIAPVVAVLADRLRLRRPHAGVEVVVDPLHAPFVVVEVPVDTGDGVSKRRAEEEARGDAALQVARGLAALAHEDREAHGGDHHERQHAEHDQQRRSLSGRGSLHRQFLLGMARSAGSRRKKFGSCAAVLKFASAPVVPSPESSVAVFSMMNS